MNYADAIANLPGGKFVARAGWKDQWLVGKKSDIGNVIEIRTPSGSTLPWRPHPEDSSATDWQFVDGIYKQMTPPEHYPSALRASSRHSVRSRNI